jgi:hypothetical protein
MLGLPCIQHLELNHHLDPYLMPNEAVEKFD